MDYPVEITADGKAIILSQTRAQTRQLNCRGHGDAGRQAGSPHLLEEPLAVQQKVLLMAVLWTQFQTAGWVRLLCASNQSLVSYVKVSGPSIKPQW